MSQQEPKQYPDLARLRIEYRLRSLSETQVDRDPVRQFVAWLNEAIAARIYEPNAMALATSTRDGSPSARMVLLKGVDDFGLTFFTNYLSRKGRELEQNPRAAVVFYWGELERQVRADGDITRTSEEESDQYFLSRPVESRIGAAASSQSDVIGSRESLEQRAEQLKKDYPDGQLPRPAHWGGYRLQPRRWEFWQGRANRLHDRLEYVADGQGAWIVRRLAP